MALCSVQNESPMSTRSPREHGNKFVPLAIAETTADFKKSIAWQEREITLRPRILMFRSRKMVNNVSVGKECPICPRPKPIARRPIQVLQTRGNGDDLLCSLITTPFIHHRRRRKNPFQFWTTLRKFLFQVWVSAFL